MGVHSQKGYGNALDIFNKDHIGVHSYINLALGVHSHLVPTKNECTPMWSLSLQRMHSNVIPFAFRSALRYGPHHFKKCTPKWFPLYRLNIVLILVENG